MHFEGDYVCESKIGTGSFAEVWKGYHKVTKQAVAVKVVDLERLSRSNNNHENKLKQHLNSELKIMKSLDHKNIVKMFDFTVLLYPYLPPLSLYLILTPYSYTIILILLHSSPYLLAHSLHHHISYQSHFTNMRLIQSKGIQSSNYYDS